MKTKLLFTSLFLLNLPLLFSQIPQGFNYQALARDGANPVINTVIPVTITIQSDSLGGTIFWKELHSSVLTNDYGLFTLVIGKGERLTQSTAATFADIDWTVTPKFINTEILYKGVPKNMGSSRLFTVPYSMVAGDIGGSLDKLQVTGKTTSLDEALFEVKNNIGQTVFAVYNEGVRIYVDDGAKGSKGGFSIGGFGIDKGNSQNYLFVSSDSIRAYIGPKSGKASKGGFAIGGFDMTKAITNEQYLHVTRDSTRIFVNDGPTKAKKGGFSIGGFDNTKGTQTVTPFTSLTPDNYFIGHNSGLKNLTGLFNSFVGYETGYGNESGSWNSLFGFQSGFSNTTGSGNLFLGYQSGYSNTGGSNNTFMGYKSGYKNTTGDKNSFLGSFTGENNTTGGGNTFSGIYAGNSNTIGNNNIFFGTNSGFANTEGNNNIFIGSESGQYNTTGNYNTFLGYRAGHVNNANNNVFIGNDCGYSNTTGNVNVFIGYAAGRSNTTGSGNMYLGNGSGHFSIDGESNVFIGERAGYNNISGSDNVFIGYLAGMKGTDTWGNVCIGFQSGQELTLAYSNVFVGENTGRKTTWGEGNVFVGNQAGESNVTGSWNVHIGTGAGQYADADDNIFIGFGSGYRTTTGNTNVFLGNQSGTNNLTGGNNVYIGNGAGYINTAGSGNVFIGKGAGWNEAGSNKLYIDNSNTTTPLIYGDFNTDNLTINGNLSAASTYFRLNTNPGTGTTPTNYCYQGSALSTSKQFAFAVNDALWVTGPSFYDSYLNLNTSGSPALYIADDEALWYNGTYFSWGYGGTYNYFARKVAIGANVNSGYALYVSGSSYTTGTWASSDARFKNDIRDISDPVDMVMKMRGVNYLWKSDEYSDKGFPAGRHYGVIAQEIEKVIPGIVNEGPDGEKAVAYNEIIPFLIEAIKKQQSQIDELEKKVAHLSKK